MGHDSECSTCLLLVLPLIFFEIREELTELGHDETTHLNSIEKFSRVLHPGGHWHYLTFGNSDTVLLGKIV